MFNLVVLAFKAALYSFGLFLLWIALSLLGWWVPFVVTGVVICAWGIKLNIEDHTPKEVPEDEDPSAEFFIDATKPGWQREYLKCLGKVFVRRMIFMILFFGIGISAASQFRASIAKARNFIRQKTAPIMEQIKDRGPDIWERMDPREQDYQKLKSVFDEGRQVRK